MNLRRPEHLTNDYEFNGPDRLFITGPLDQARTATAIYKAIRAIAGPIGTWWPNLDSSLFFLGGSVPNTIRSEVNRTKAEDSNRLAFDYSQYGEIMFVNENKKLDTATAYKIGRAVASPEIAITYYFGDESSLGDLGVLSKDNKIKVIDDPVNVFRWQAESGQALVADSTHLIDINGYKEAMKL